MNEITSILYVKTAYHFRCFWILNTKTQNLQRHRWRTPRKEKERQRFFYCHANITARGQHYHKSTVLPTIYSLEGNLNCGCYFSQNISQHYLLMYMILHNINKYTFPSHLNLKNNKILVHYR